MRTSAFVDQSQCAQHNIFPGVNVFTAAGEEMMLSLAVLEPHAVVERHSHPHEQVGMVISGSARFIVGEEDKVLSPGEMYLIPGGMPHRVIALDEGCQALDIFHPIREDYR
ncbi:MAG: cupin domain-containing protein [Planctomycetaceae bacterium]|nr:cupin domain-containing protein [Planctomycetaceae bacterium]